MGQILPANSFNPAAVGASDLYILIINPPSYIRGVPTDVIGLVGTGSWGPVNAAVHFGSATDAAAIFGPISAASLVDPYDMATDVAVAFQQQQAGVSAIEGFGVRVTDGTDVAAAASLSGAATASSKTATLTGTVTGSDVLTLTVSSSALTGSPISVSYTVKNTDGLPSIANGLALAVNSNAILVAAGIAALSPGATVVLYAPTSLTPAPTWTSSTSGGATEIITITSSGTSTVGGVVSGIYTGTLGNQVSVGFLPGSQTGGITVSVNPPSGIAETYPNIPATNFWQRLAAAFANGLSGVRGPSAIVRLSVVNIAVGAPTTGTSVTLSGGTDGRSGVTLANIIGSDTDTPKTGMYALRSQNPAVGIVWLTGVTDPTAVPSLKALADSEGMCALSAFPINTSSAVATAAVQTIGVHGPSVTYTKDWTYFFDSVNNVTRPITPNAMIGGTWAALGPQYSPGNTPVQLCLGTDRSPPGQVGAPYTDSETGQLANAGITFITNPIPAGSEWGIREGRCTSLDAVTQPMEYWRMTSYIARSLNSSMGTFIGQLQSQRPNDPLRQAVKLKLNNFIQQMIGANQIDDGISVCNFSAAANAVPGLGLNTPASVAQHYLYALVQCRYLSSVWYFILSLQGGTTVVTVAGQQPSQTQ